MTSYVENEAKESLPFEPKEILDLVAQKVLEEENCPYEAQINLLLTDNEGIREFNRQYREVDAPTDVLSFPMIPFEREADFTAVEEDGADYFDPGSGELILGDIIISVPRALEQAESFGHSVKREFAFLVAHSMLHLCGYDHMEEEEAKVMEAKQEKVLKELGITRD